MTCLNSCFALYKRRVAKYRAFIFQRSLHREPRSSTREDLIGDSDFLYSAPVVFMAPGVAPSQEIEHRDVGNKKAAQEGLLADNWEEEEGQDA